MHWNPHLVLGGLSMPIEMREVFEITVRSARLPELPFGEMKWTKVSPGKLAAYTRVVDAVFASAIFRHSLVEFHSLVVDTTKLKDKTFNQGSREVGFNKEIFQLCQKFGRADRRSIFNVYLDKRETKSSTDELRNILNHGIRKSQPGRDWPFRRVHFRDSADCLSLQVVDIFIGAIAFRLNGHGDAQNASRAKISMSDRILSLAGIRDINRDTNVTGRFTLWHRILR